MPALTRIRRPSGTSSVEYLRISRQTSGCEFERCGGDPLIVHGSQIAGSSLQRSSLIPQQISNIRQTSLIPIAGNAKALLRFRNRGFGYLDSPLSSNIRQTSLILIPGNENET